MVLVAKVIPKSKTFVQIFHPQFRYEFGNNVIYQLNGRTMAATTLTKRMKKVMCENQS
jgi:hypothetical protein